MCIPSATSLRTGPDLLVDSVWCRSLKLLHVTVDGEQVGLAVYLGSEFSVFESGLRLQPSGSGCPGRTRQQCCQPRCPARTCRVPQGARGARSRAAKPEPRGAQPTRRRADHHRLEARADREAAGDQRRLDRCNLRRPCWWARGGPAGPEARPPGLRCALRWGRRGDGVLLSTRRDGVLCAPATPSTR